MALTVREACPSDAPALLAHVDALLREPGVDVPLDPGEFQLSEAEERRILAQSAASDNGAFFTAWEDGALRGELSLKGGTLPAGRHRATLGMSVARPARGRGIGRALLEHAVRWARDSSRLTRIELDVYDRNAAARRLYESAGFVAEARRRGAVREDGRLLDTWTMGLCFDGKRPATAGSEPQPYVPAPRAPAGARVVLRAAGPQDAEPLRALWRAMRRDPALLVPTAGERQLPCEGAFRQRFDALLRADNGCAVVAESDAGLVGVAEARGHDRRALKHEALVAIGVRDGWRGRGIGGGLLEALEAQARSGGALERLMLFVYVENERAQALYRRCGYEIEGRLRNAWYQRGRYFDEWMMARLLD